MTVEKTSADRNESGRAYYNPVANGETHGCVSHQTANTGRYTNPYPPTKNKRDVQIQPTYSDDWRDPIEGLARDSLFTSRRSGRKAKKLRHGLGKSKSGRIGRPRRPTRKGQAHENLALSNYNDVGCLDARMQRSLHELPPSALPGLNMAINVATLSHHERELFISLAPESLQDPCTLMETVSSERSQMMKTCSSRSPLLSPSQSGIRQRRSTDSTHKSSEDDTYTQQKHGCSAGPTCINLVGGLMTPEEDEGPDSRPQELDQEPSKWGGLHNDPINSCFWETYFGEKISDNM
jgi:hypothetical protein